jgi:hypothetical protein
MQSKIIKFIIIGLLFVIGELFFSVLSNLISESQPIKETVKKIEDYWRDKKQNDSSTTLTKTTNQPLILSLQSTKKSYSVHEKIELTIQLSQEVYLYLLSPSDQELCLLFPNTKDPLNLYTPQNTLIPATKSYSLQSTTKGEEKFTLLGSLKPLKFKDFKPKGIYRCIGHNEGIKSIQRLQSMGVESQQLRVMIR